jgi:hypothetical protein
MTLELSESDEYWSSAAGRRNVSENIGAEILSTWTCVRNWLKQRLLLNFTVTKSEDEWNVLVTT